MNMPPPPPPRLLAPVSNQKHLEKCLTSEFHPYSVFLQTYHTPPPPPATSHQPPLTTHHPPHTSHHTPPTTHHPPPTCTCMQYMYFLLPTERARLTRHAHPPCTLLHSSPLNRVYMYTQPHNGRMSFLRHACCALID